LKAIHNADAYAAVTEFVVLEVKDTKFEPEVTDRREVKEFTTQ